MGNKKWSLRVGSPSVIAAIVALMLCSSVVHAAQQFTYDGLATGFGAFKRVFGISDSDWPSPETIAYFGEDDAVRYAHWKPQGAPVGTVVHFNGRTEFIERNIYTYKDLLDRGYEVWTLDWPGQGMSKRTFDDLQVGHIEDFDQYLDAAQTFVNDIIRLHDVPGRKVLLAHSMGGQIATRYLLEYPDQFDVAVMSSPLLSLPTIQNEWNSWAINAGNWFKTLIWPASACIVDSEPEWQGKFIDACPNLQQGLAIGDQQLSDQSSKAARELSHDFGKLNATQCLIDASIKARSANDGRDLRVSCATSVWTRAALRSISIVEDAKHQLCTPTLILAAHDDTAVGNQGQKDFCLDNVNCSLKMFSTTTRGMHDGVEYLMFEKLANVGLGEAAHTDMGHELLIEEEAVRTAFLQEFDKHVSNATPVGESCR